ncbi:syntaxin-like [Aphidius gifuensis]|uniref:syntaxin-like n=1 Tax=Aphidius gifuensis TaxID=684658 RepID=UPI001CDD77D7|nr:syntaxin-like [Aphidius gifuensis]
MVRDRLPDLFANQRNNSIGRRFSDDIYIHLTQNRRLQSILDDVDKVRRMIDILQDDVNIVKNLHKNNLSHLNSDSQTELKRRTFKISQVAFQIRNELEKIGKSMPEVNDLRLRASLTGPIHERVRTVQYFTMLRTFSVVMYDYNDSVLSYHAQYYSILDQQKQIMKKKNIDSLLTDQANDDDVKTSLFVDNFLDDTKVAIYQLSELQSRHTEIMKLEKSLIDIRDMFSELAFLVEKQSGQLNCVEYFARQASDQVDNGRYNIVKAKQKNKKRKKKIRCFSVLLTIIIFIFLIVILII